MREREALKIIPGLGPETSLGLRGEIGVPCRIGQQVYGEGREYMGTEVRKDCALKRYMCEFWAPKGVSKAVKRNDYVRGSLGLNGL